MTSGRTTVYERAMAIEDLKKAEESLRKTQTNLARQEQALGVREQQEVNNLKKNLFLTKRMNARALKKRIQEHQRQYYFCKSIDTVSDRDLQI
jgi:hypothetical protein